MGSVLVAWRAEDNPRVGQAHAGTKSSARAHVQSPLQRERSCACPLMRRTHLKTKTESKSRPNAVKRRSVCSRLLACPTRFQTPSSRQGGDSCMGAISGSTYFVKMPTEIPANVARWRSSHTCTACTCTRRWQGGSDHTAGGGEHLLVRPKSSRAHPGGLGARRSYVMSHTVGLGHVGALPHPNRLAIHRSPKPGHIYEKRWLGVQNLAVRASRLKKGNVLQVMVRGGLARESAAG